MAGELTSADLNGLNRALFEWADSYDNKDWSRLATNCAPTLRVEYREIGLGDYPEISAADFVAMCSHENFLGNPRVACQHLIGASFFTLTGSDEAEGRHQIRAAHQVYVDDARTAVSFVGHAHASNTHWYRRVDGVWKFAGLRPKVLWCEGEGLDKVWAPREQASS